MVVLKRKTRMVSFRLSEEQYEALVHASFSTGARSVSDYARDTLFDCLDIQNRGTAAGALESRVERIALDVESLTRNMRQLQAAVIPTGPQTRK